MISVYRSVYRSSLGEKRKLRAARGSGITATNTNTDRKASQKSESKSNRGFTCWAPRLSLSCSRRLFRAPLSHSTAGGTRLPLGRFAFGKTPRGPRCARQARQRLASQTLPGLLLSLHNLVGLMSVVKPA